MENSSSRLSQLYTTLADSRQSRFLRDMTPTLAIWFGAWCIPAFTGLFFAQSLVQCAVFLLIGYIGARWYKWGPGIYYPRDWWRGWWIKRNNGRLYIGDPADEPDNGESPQDVASQTIPRDKTANRRFRMKQGQQAITLDPTNFLGIVGSLHDPESDVDTVYVRTHGWKHVNDGVVQRHDADLRLLNVLKNVIAQLPGDIGFCSLTCPRPFDPEPLSQDLKQNFLREEVVHATSDDDPTEYRLQTHINALLLKAGMSGREYFGLYALSVRRPQSWQAFAKNPSEFTKKHLLESPLMYVLDTLVDGLKAEGFQDVHIFNREELYDFIFRTWNVSYIEQVLVGRKSAKRKPGDNPWPRHSIVVDGPNRVIKIDDSYHRVLVTTHYGIRRVLAGGFHELMTGNKRWVSMSVPYVTVSKGLESWLLKQSRDLTVAYQNERYKGGMIEDAESRDRRRATVDKVDAIYLSGSKPIRSNRYFIVSGSSMQQLEEAQRHLVAKLRRRQIRVEPVRGRARMLRAFLAASLGLSL